MKLISCHVENFGCLHDFNYIFSEGLNVFLQKNGWGKSTFAAFLCAMFYGMPGKGKNRSGRDQMRTACRPWQGGVYGGSLVFEAGGRTYEMSRIFGRREGEDEFDLRDAETNLPSFDYSKEIGRELFRIDRASFLRTVYISERDCETQATDDIHALTADLADRAGDMRHYEEAQKHLRDAANRLTPERASGRLHQISARIGQLEQKKQESRGLATELDQCRENLQVLYREKETLEGLQEQVAEEIEEAGRREEAVHKNRTGDGRYAAGQQILQRLTDTRDRRQRQAREAAACFPGRIPAREEADLFLQKLRQVERLEDRMQAQMLTEEEQRRLTALEERFSDRTMGTVPPEEPFSDRAARQNYPEKRLWDRTMGTDSMRPHAADKEILPAVKTDGRTAIKGDPAPAAGILLLSGLLLLVLALACKWPFPAAGIAGTCSLLLLAGGIYVYLNAKSHGADPAPFHRKGKTRPSHSRPADSVSAQALTGKLTNTSINTSANTDAETEGRRAYEEFQYLAKKEEDLEKAHADWAEARKPILGFVRELGLPLPEEEGESLRASLTAVRDAADEYEDARSLLQEAEEELRLFESELKRELKNELEKEPGERAAGLQKETGRMKDPPCSLSELRQRREEVFERLLQNREKTGEELRRAESLRAELEEGEAVEKELADLYLQQKQDRDQYRHITMASAILQKARESLTARHADPIRKHFCDHWETLTGGPSAGVQLDSNSVVTVEKEGKQRETGSLSTGYRDLAGICLRVALADAMYCDAARERPVLIMDDPFTNLDDEKTAGAMRFLRETAARYQIIYFTCSRSRTI